MKATGLLDSGDYFNIMRWKVVKITGWTLDYIDSLPLGKLYECIQIEDGLTKAQG